MIETFRAIGYSIEAAVADVMIILYLLKQRMFG
jgi:hypothetical protein